MAKYVAQQTGKNVEDVPYDVLTSPQLKRRIWSSYILYCY